MNLLRSSMDPITRPWVTLNALRLEDDGVLRVCTTNFVPNEEARGKQRETAHLV